jgi:ferritin
MLISERMAKALSDELANEYGAAIQYTMISAYFGREALPQLAGLFRHQAAEELTHAQKIVDYVTEAGAVVEIPAIPQGESEFDSIAEAVTIAVEAEKDVAGVFNELMDLAIEEHDHLSRGFLQWFVDEQMEEVSTMEDLLKVVERAGDNLLYVEDYVASRPPPVGPSD